MRTLERSSTVRVGKKKRRANKRHSRTGGRRKLSLCVIARDEAARLDCCLTSVRGLADDIVVGDTGSRDNTVAVARKHGASVTDLPWQGEFSQARNESLARARGEWILVLDCDEVISPADHRTVLALIGSSEVDAYLMTTRNYIDESDRVGWRPCGDTRYVREEGKYDGWFPTTKVRLWRRRPEIQFEGAVHELVEPSLQRVGARVEDCIAPVHHYGYGGDRGRRDSAYVEAGERKIAECPDDLQAQYEIAIAYRNVGRLDESSRAIELVIAGFDGGRSVEAYPYLQEEYVHLVYADVLSRQGRLDDALRVLESLTGRFPESYQAYNNMGSLFGRKGDVEAAVACYRAGLEKAPDNLVLQENLAKFERALQPNAGGVDADEGAPPALYTLSCCIIVRNGTTTFDRCLGSVVDVVDEICVVDTGSDDNSIEIAQRYGARIERVPWCDDFSAARNRSLDMATSDWVVWMDADDYMLPEDRGRLDRARRLKPDRGLYFTLINEGGTEQSRFRQIKMFPNLPDIRFSRPVHETVQPALERVGMVVAPTDVEVRHTGYADGTETARKQRYYLQLMLEWLESNPDDYDIRFRVGHTHFADGRGDLAIDCFDCILEAGPQAVTRTSITRMAATLRGRIRLERGDLDGALLDLEVALAINGSDVLANLSSGDALTKKGDYERALPHLKAALAGRPDPTFPFDSVLIEYRYYRCV